MAGCGDLEEGMRDINRRLRDLERNSGGSGGGSNNFDEERIVRKVLERLFKHPKWIAVIECLEFIIKGKVS